AAQPFDAELGLGRAALALEPERPGDHADRERAERACHVRDHRSTAGARAAALPRGDEDHVGALEHLFDLLAVVLGRPRANVRVGTGAKTAGQFPTDRSEEHTSELQSRENLVCRLLLEKKK